MTLQRLAEAIEARRPPYSHTSEAEAAWVTIHLPSGTMLLLPGPEYWIRVSKEGRIRLFDETDVILSLALEDFLNLEVRLRAVRHADTIVVDVKGDAE